MRTQDKDTKRYDALMLSVKEFKPILSDATEQTNSERDSYAGRDLVRVGYAVLKDNFELYNRYLKLYRKKYKTNC